MISVDTKSFTLRPFSHCYKYLGLSLFLGTGCEGRVELTELLYLERGLIGKV